MSTNSNRYFKDYNPILPILDPRRRPNQYYDESSLLFWAIVVTAARSYAATDSTCLLQTLRPKVIDLALATTKATPSEKSIIALLILLTWPLSSNRQAHDLTFVLDGVMFQMALQTGLHTPKNVQEYSPFELDLCDQDNTRRSILWASCLLTHQSICLIKGVPVIALEDVCLDPGAVQQLLHSIPKCLRADLQMQDLLRSCCSTVGRLGLQYLSEDQEAALDIHVASFEQQLRMIKMPQERTPTTELRQFTADLQIMSLYLYKKPKSLARQPVVLSKLYTKATKVVENLRSLLTDCHCAASAVPLYFLYGLFAASCVLLRLIKSPAFRNSAYEHHAQLVTVRAIELAKELSVEQCDLPSRTSIIVRQLLVSEKAFIHPDTSTEEFESRSVPLRARGRLMASHIIDTAAWWRDEYRGRTDMNTVSIENFGPTKIALHGIGSRSETQAHPIVTTPPSTRAQQVRSDSELMPHESPALEPTDQTLSREVLLNDWRLWSEMEDWIFPDPIYGFLSE